MSIDALEFATLALDTASPSLVVLQGALKCCQTELQRAREEIRQLKIENEMLKGASSISTGSTSQSGGKTINWLKNPRLYHRAQDIINFAKKIAAMEELWLNECVFLQPFPTSVPSLLERHASPDAYNHYIVHVLYSHLDPTMHQFFEQLPAFRDGVLHQQTEFRSAVVSSGRKHLLQIMDGFNIPSVCSQRTHDRTKELSCVRLLSWTHSSTNELIKYDLYPPIVYEDVNDKNSKLFYQLALMKIARIILFGPTALTKLSLPPKSSGLKWGPLKTTPGLISACVTIAIYLLSGDQAFESIGGKTKIPYAAQFQLRKKLLEKVAGEKQTQALFKCWDEYVFAGAPPSVHDTNDNGDSGPDEQEEAQRAFMRNVPETSGEEISWGQELDYESDELETFISKPVHEEQFQQTHSSISTPIAAPTPLVPALPVAPTLSPIITHSTHGPGPLPIVSSQTSRGRRVARPTPVSGTLTAFAPILSAAEVTPLENPDTGTLPDITQDLVAMELVDDVTLEIPNSTARGRGRGRGARGRGSVGADIAPRTTRRSRK